MEGGLCGGHGVNMEVFLLMSVVNFEGTYVRYRLFAFGNINLEN